MTCGTWSLSERHKAISTGVEAHSWSASSGRPTFSDLGSKTGRALHSHQHKRNTHCSPDETMNQDECFLP